MADCQDCKDFDWNFKQEKKIKEMKTDKKALSDVKELGIGLSQDVGKAVIENIIVIPDLP